MAATLSSRNPFASKSVPAISHASALSTSSSESVLQNHGNNEKKSGIIKKALRAFRRGSPPRNEEDDLEKTLEEKEAKVVTISKKTLELISNLNVKTKGSPKPPPASQPPAQHLKAHQKIMKQQQQLKLVLKQITDDVDDEALVETSRITPLPSPSISRSNSFKNLASPKEPSVENESPIAVARLAIKGSTRNSILEERQMVQQKLKSKRPVQTFEAPRSLFTNPRNSSRDDPSSSSDGSGSDDDLIENDKDETAPQPTITCEDLLRKNKADQLPEYKMKKILFLGDQSVGKSSLLRHFVDGSFSDALSSTCGVDYKVQFFHDEENHCQYKCQLWDTAGKPEFHVITRAYYKAAHVIALVYDSCDRKSFDNLQYWKESVGKYGSEHTQLVLVANKIDGSREVSREDGLAMAFALNAQYTESCAMERESVQDLFELLVNSHHRQ